MTEDKINEIIKETLRRLALPRVGLLCDEAGPLPECDRFVWVAYPRKGEAGKRVHPLPELRKPEDEGAGLRLLVALGCPLTVVGELLDGVPRSSEGALILGCLGRGVPVLLEGSFSAWAWYGETACGKHLASRLERLRSWGLHILGEPEAAKGAERASERSTQAERAERNQRDEGDTLVLRDAGWTAWRDLDGRLGGITAVRLEGRTKLTMQAREQLDRLHIKVLGA